MSTMLEKLAALQKKRGDAMDKFAAIAGKDGFDEAKDKAAYDAAKKEVDDLDAQIVRVKEARELEAKTAKPVAGQDNADRFDTVAAAVEADPYISEEAAKARNLGTRKGLIVGGIAKALLMAGGSPFNARDAATKSYGENHAVTKAIAQALADVANPTPRQKALMGGIGSSGGFIIPPEYVNEIIELLRPRAVVRAANPRSMPMPRGTMTLPAQTAAATATYGGERAKITASQQKLGQIVATYKKLTALVPVTNDLMRFSDPAADAFVRDDLVKIVALREDLAFLTGDGTQDTPRGFTSFANAWALQTGGTSGAWLADANSTPATGGNFLSSADSFDLSTVAAELGGLVNKLDTANVPDIRRRWFFHPRIYNYLNNLLNDLGLYVYRDELAKGTLLGYPYSKTTQIPINLHNADSSHTDCTFIMLVEMDDALILDSMTLELAVSREGTYYDATGTLQSAFQQDETLIRAIAEHDFQMRHPASVAVDQNVRWAPAS